MKILYHHRTLGDGAEGVHIASMVEAFRALGHEVRVVSLIGGRTNVSTPRTRGLTRLARRLPRPLYESAELLYSAPAYTRLVREIRRWQPDLVYERYALFNLAGVLAARRTATPLVLEVNAPIAWERARYERLSLPAVAHLCERFVYRHADRLAAVSSPLKRHLVEAGAADERVTVIPNGADPSRFRPDAAARAAVRAAHRIPANAVVIGFTGILRPWHGPELLLDAAARLAPRSDVRLLFAGDGPARAAVEAHAAARGLADRLTVTGRLPHDDIPRYAAAFDIAVSPRTTFYASPMKVPEYMAAGAAVVAPDSDNLRDLITDRHDGLLFAQEDTASLTAALQRLIDSPPLRERLGTAARATVMAHRTWEGNARRVLALTTEARRCA